MNHELTYTVLLEPAEEGGFVVIVPAFNHAATQGETYEEALAMAKDLIEGYIQVYLDEGWALPREVAPALSTQVTIREPIIAA